MVDSFFAATTDLDRILDELEENEVPAKSVSSPYAAAKDQSVSPGKHKQSIPAPASIVNHQNTEAPWDAIDDNTPLSNGLNHEPDVGLVKPTNKETDLLVDFGDVLASPSVDEAQINPPVPSSFSELDFLLSLSPEPFCSNNSTVVSNTINILPEIPLNHGKESPTHVENVGKTEELIVQDVNNDAKAVGLLSSRNSVEEEEALLNEFESFMATEDESQIVDTNTSTATEAESEEQHAKSEVDKICNTSGSTPTETNHPPLEHVINTDYAEDSMHEENDEPTQPCSELCLPTDNVDNSTVLVDDVGLNNVQVEEQPVPNSMPTTDISQPTTISVNQSHDRQEPDQEINGQTSVDMGDGISDQSFPDFSPPSYSAVLAEDKAAHRQISQPQRQDEAPHHGLEARNMEPQLQVDSQDSRSQDRTDRISQPVVHTLPMPIVSRPGKHKPIWVPDKESPACTKCGTPFSFTRRRHHCRACGRIFCSTCCSEKAKLEYMEFDEVRVCVECNAEILRADTMAAQRNVVLPSPNMPSPPSSAPRPVLKATDSDASDAGNNTGNSKSVRFSDGTRPDHPDTLPATPPPPSRMPRAGRTRQRNPAQDSPFPPVIVDTYDDGSLVIEEYPDQALITTLLQPDNLKPLRFALGPNLYVSLRVIKYKSIPCYYFVSHGLDTVGQAEVAFILQIKHSAYDLPLHAFTIYSFLFTNSRKGKPVHALDFVPASDMISEEPYFGVADLIGTLFVRKTFQIIDLEEESDPSFSSLTVKPSSTLFALLVHKSEKPWATLFPSRLLLGLGASSKEFPYPITNSLERKSVYPETANTILGILCDLRNFKYKVVTVPGLSVTIKEHGILISIPVNRFNEIVKILNSSNEHVLALGSDVLSCQDENFQSHLVAVQDHSNLSYHTEVLQRSLSNVGETSPDTGVAFVVFNGSLKSGHTQQARCTIVEDGLMVQILPEKMAALKEALKAMDDFLINCNPPEQDTSVETQATKQTCKFVEVRWVADDTKFNIGLSSPIDFMSFEGVIGYNVQGKSEKKGKQQVLRWNQVFFFKSTNDVLDMSRLAKQMADGCFQALVPQMKLLRSSRQTKIGIRFNIHPDDVGYAVGSQGMPLPDPCLNALDENLIFLLHDASANLHREDDVVVFELIFCVLEMRSTWKTMQ